MNLRVTSTLIKKLTRVHCYHVSEISNGSHYPKTQLQSSVKEADDIISQIIYRYARRSLIQRLLRARENATTADKLDLLKISSSLEQQGLGCST